MALNPQWAQARNLLAVRLDSMGDVLMTTPALSAIRRSLPHARISLLTSSAGAEAARGSDMVDSILEYAAPWTGPLSAAGNPESDNRFIERLAVQGFDAAIIFTVCTQSALPAALACRLAGIPLRLAHCRENPYALLTHWVPETDLTLGIARHEVQRQLDLVAHVGFHTSDTLLRMQWTEDDKVGMQHALARSGASANVPTIVVHPGASAASRRYPAERFGIIANALQQRTGWQIVFTGSADEVGLIDAAMAHMESPAFSLAGTLTLGAMAALLSGARLLLCNNTGPAHIAAATQTPSVVLYAQTNPQHTPWQTPSRVLTHDVPCRNCLKSHCTALHHACLEGITPQQAVAAALELIAERRCREAHMPDVPGDPSFTTCGGPGLSPGRLAPSHSIV